MPKLQTAQTAVRTITRCVYSALNPSHPLHPINRYHGYRVMMLEGFISSAEALFFRHLLLQELWIKRVLEIGFNGGHSSFTFLDTRSDVEVVSFDLGSHGYVRHAKGFIDSRFPGRHELVIGNSLLSVPDYARSHPDECFDLLFIDGGHTFEIASQDLGNCRCLASTKHMVVIDDLAPWKPWGIGPAKAWRQAQEEGLVIQDTVYRNGKLVTSVSGTGADNIWAVGRYLNEPNT